MACTSISISTATSSSSTAAKEIVAGTRGIRRSDSGNDLRCGIRRSRSEPQLRCSMNATPTAAAPARIKSSRSVGLFPFSIAGSIIPNSIRSLLFESEEEAAAAASGGMRLAESAESETEKRANWVERLLELRNRWRDRQDEGNADCYCGVSYDSDSEESESEESDGEWDRERFSRYLARVPWSETKLFSQLAFLCNMAYVIAEMKAEDLRKYYDLRLVTSSLEKKSEAALKAKLEGDSTRPPSTPSLPDPGPDPDAGYNPKRPIRPSAAYEIAASAASYVHARAKGLLSLGGGGSGEEKGREDGKKTAGTARGERGYKSEVAAFVAASTMTAVVALEEDARLEAARDLQSLHSSPCEWFVCDDPSTCTRCFVIQGSDSLASWQANLFFEPTKFEGTEVLVHRGIYEAAKGIYEQFLPEIQAHINLHGEDRARLRFTGHSLGGSLSLLVSLMLLARGAVPQSALLPVVTFGSPSVFCGGRRVLDALGLDEGHICSVMMHRDIVPRAFSCNYPHHVAQVLKRLNGAFRSHPCLNVEKLLYSPLGKLYILQPDEKSSPPHPLLASGAALYSLKTKDMITGAPLSGTGSALRAFLNSPHPLETLSDPTAYGSDGTILRDHDSSNYLKAVNGLIRQHTKSVVRRSRRQRLTHWWPLLTMSPGTPSTRAAWGEPNLEKPGLVAKEMVTGV